MEESAAAAQEEDGSEVAASWLVVDEETASELSELLDMLEAPPPVRFIDDPYSSPVVVQSSSAYVTINCNEESCGSSFSFSDSSVMASVDVGRAATAASAWTLADAEEREIGECDVDLGGFLKDDGGGIDGGDAALLEFLGGIFE
ncbi:hypothetical protein SASPL_109780 [Salvia splendens]|uniref:Uncharacterized protein n=1 Tax=Salvia splendens TaxID=180675 RepID=A0A8X9A7W7_SALSN|nr:hypothetical protein SASPL_109780 [Salvia splendens]